ncbi:MAG: DUF262 domain-containing protein [Jaaginema sp. PMC 1079.18]|nr:DUF262 domain-containing protein [Jaaginema sp. PMC 1080.18]MEC4851440.1 DUF262 domain-containing protein [Jaaginema sp. PMC 1079.18]MEC4868257.1 DUF262 domain-containing protein [Jaaginema sp. PMC 1078.18]
MAEITQQNFFLDSDDLEEEYFEGINRPFDPTKIRVDTRKITIDLLLKRIWYGELNLNPDFQRQNIWTQKAKSLLIESILIRIPLPAFYIDATDDDRWVVIDGLQRLTTLKEFVVDKKNQVDKPLQLTELQYLTELEGKYYSQLHRKYQRRILETELTLSMIEPGTPPAVKYNIFRRINTGGMPLSPQEMRHALNQGKATKLLERLSLFPEFIRATEFDNSKKRKRMIDREFILGFLAYSIYGYTKYSEFESRDTFFVDTMTLINNEFSEQNLEDIENKFKKAMVAAYEIFGENTFRKIPKPGGRRFPLNQALFEVWSVTLSHLGDREIELLKQCKNTLIQKFSDLADQDRSFLQSISQATQKVELRFRTVEQLVQEVLM